MLTAASRHNLNEASPLPLEQVADNGELSHPVDANAIQIALLESRQRWRDLALMIGDLAFETDASGHFVFVAPRTVLGWSADALIGQSDAVLLAGDDAMQLFNPFRSSVAVSQRRVWLKHANGSAACFCFAATPLFDQAGQIIGARGIAQDVTAQEKHDAAIAILLRRGEVLDHILWRMRQEVLAPRMMMAALEEITIAMSLEGAGVIDLMGDGAGPAVLHQTGADIEIILPLALQLLRQSSSHPTHMITPVAQPLLICPCQTQFGEQVGLVLWRGPHGRGFDTDDLMLSSSVSGLVRVILEHEAIQREMTLQARTDPLTGLLNRRAFFGDITRRLDRLERENLPGTLLFVDLDYFKALNDRCGHEMGDKALRLTATLLRDAVRPHDLVARLGGDEFALWLDGADEFAAAERAETLRVETPKKLIELTGDLPLNLTMSIGIATRWPGRDEDLTAITQRADEAMYEAKRSGRGHWRISRLENQ